MHLKFKNDFIFNILASKLICFLADDTDGDIDKDEPLSMFDNDDETESTTEKVNRDDSDNLQDTSLMFRNGHISLFGEIIHDMEPSSTDDVRIPPAPTTGSHKNVNMHQKNINYL